jgi:holliday junction DNA helicase RuvA
MIGYLKGEVINISKQNITLLCGQVGYEIFCTSNFSENLEKNSQLELFIFTRVREDDISLYGFAKQEEIQFFKLLISVNGVGPKTALEIMGAEINQIKNAILQENAVFLSKTPGIGKKTAERIIVDLKNSVIPDSYLELDKKLDQQLEEVAVALKKLGYQKGEIHKVLTDLPEKTKSTEEIVTFFLQNV